MHTSHYFESQIAKAEKKHHQDSSFPLEQHIAESFFRAVNLPQAMGLELYDQFFQDRNQLIRLVDFFNEPEVQQFSDLPFSREEWQDISDLTNRFADELDLERLQSLYQFFIAHHLLRYQNKEE